MTTNVSWWAFLPILGIVALVSVYPELLGFARWGVDSFVVLGLAVAGFVVFGVKVCKQVKGENK